MTLTGKRPPDRDPESQLTELLQDTTALMVQDAKIHTQQVEREREREKGGGRERGGEREHLVLHSLVRQERLRRLENWLAR